MDNASADTPSTVRTPEDRLDSWKAIAVYLDRDVTTVQRWEKREGMPVHRHLHDRKGSVYASRAELNAWARSRNIPAQPENSPPTANPDAAAPAKPASRARWKLFFWAAAAGAVLLIAAIVWLQRMEYFWRDPIVDARFQSITNSEGVEQAAAVSRDGRYVAFLSDRDGQMDVWVTQAGSGEFHNLTHGSTPELVNPSVRTLGFSPDGSLVTFWVRKPNSTKSRGISIWAVPTLGGQPRPYLEGVAEYDWSHDGSRLAYHTPGSGDPLFVSNGSLEPAHPIFTAPAGLHSHFPLWSRDGEFIYVVEGTLPDKLDIWRIPSKGGAAERITSRATSVSHPVLLDQHTLMYLATNPDGSGPSLYSMDVRHRIPHRLSPGTERYTSLAASADGHRLVVTIANSKSTLWRLRIGNSPAEASAPAVIPLANGAGFAPRLGPNYLLYVSDAGPSESLWKLANGATSELWVGHEARIIGAPAVSPDGRRIALSIRQDGRTLLYLMQHDGTDLRMVTDSLDLQGDPAWTPDGKFITTAANDHGVPHLMQVPIDGGSPRALLQDYSLGPAWSPDGRFVLFSGPDIGTTFSLKAVAPDTTVHPLPSLTLTRGGRHLTVLPGGQSVVVLRGGIQHKDLWAIDLQTGTEHQLTNLPPDFNIRDFDLSPDGHEVVLERVQDRSDVSLLDLTER